MTGEVFLRMIPLLAAHGIHTLRDARRAAEKIQPRSSTERATPPGLARSSPITQSTPFAIMTFVATLARELAVQGKPDRSRRQLAGWRRHRAFVARYRKEATGGWTILNYACWKNGSADLRRSWRIDAASSSPASANRGS